MVGIIILPVAKGSPGPFDKKTPLGSLFKISSIFERAGRTVGEKLQLFRLRRIFF